MRSLSAGVSLGLLLSAVVGCNVLSPHRRDTGGQPVVTDDRLPTVEALVGYLNRNADRVGENALKCTNLTIDCKANSQAVGLGGSMMCQKPRNFRLTAKVVGQPAVDIGSNKDEFWYWISKNEPPYLFHCSYDALARGANIPFPFQPDMVVTALGIAHYDADRKYELNAPPKANYFELVESITSPQGQPIQKVVVFDRSERFPPQPQVIAYVLRDAKGTIICKAMIESVQQNRDTGAILPRKVSFNWPAQQLQMKLEMNDLQVITMNPDLSERVFSRRNLSYQSYDLAARTLDGPGGVQRAGATAPTLPR
jgi:hypothetical protein